uniref:NAD kinase 2, mitochondrial n=1 Tax=Strigamia maritima TaxID=126957 RepID=T1JBC5_STRMM
MMIKNLNKLIRTDGWMHSTISNRRKVTATPQFHPKKVLVLSKITRYEFEKRRHPNLSEEQLTDALAKRGSDYKGLLYHHDIHTKCLNLVTETLRRHNIETRVVQRSNYKEECIDWADAILSTGGDGTFLLGASRIQDSNKLIIGINSDPSRSEGYLCLPAKYSTDFPLAMKKLLEGRFRWNLRHRVRITLTGENAFEPPLELHDSQLTYPEYRFMDCIQEHHKAALLLPKNTDNRQVRVLPILALNEVFIGESLSSRVSYYEISIDGSLRVKQKSSGVTICTGTGSSSWYFNINKLTQQCVQNLLNIVKQETGCGISVTPELENKIRSKFNNSLYFDPGELKMAYTIRDPVVNGTVYTSEPRGFANSIEIKSRCFNACLVIDGGLSFVFNDGATALFDMFPEDALRSVILLED